MIRTGRLTGDGGCRKGEGEGVAMLCVAGTNIGTALGGKGGMKQCRLKLKLSGVSLNDAFFRSISSSGFILLPMPMPATATVARLPRYRSGGGVSERNYNGRK